jgi:predicted transcriptional regulator
MRNVMADETSDEPAKVTPVLGLACLVLEAYIRKNPLPAGEVPVALRKIYATLLALSAAAPAQTSARPAVSLRKSITDDYLICLEDGHKMSMLKRHLQTRHGLSPDQYRAKWGLPTNYPMTAPRYAKTRSALAKKAGLGRYPGPGRARARSGRNP